MLSANIQGKKKRPDVKLPLIWYILVKDVNWSIMIIFAVEQHECLVDLDPVVIVRHLIIFVVLAVETDESIILKVTQNK